MQGITWDAFPRTRDRIGGAALSKVVTKWEYEVRYSAQPVNRAQRLRNGWLWNGMIDGRCWWCVWDNTYDNPRAIRVGGSLDREKAPYGMPYTGTTETEKGNLPYLS